MSTANDVRSILSSFDDEFSNGAVSSPCILNRFDELVESDNFGGSKQTVRRTTVLVCADNYPDLGTDASVTVNGANYTVLDTQLIQDGHMLEVNLQKV